LGEGFRDHQTTVRERVKMRVRSLVTGERPTEGTYDDNKVVNPIAKKVEATDDHPEVVDKPDLKYNYFNVRGHSKYMHSLRLRFFGWFEIGDCS